MDKNLISELAQQIVHQQIAQNWEIYLLILGLLFLATGAGSFLGAYFKRRGEQFATKTDMEAILAQLKQTTQTAKSIESAISVDEWSHKEYRTTRRLKLEELILASSGLHDWFERETQWKVYGGKENNQVCPIGTVELLTNLYFPELDREMRHLTVARLQHSGWLNEAEWKILEAKKTGGQDAYVLAVREATEKYGDTGERLSNATNAFAKKGRKVMAEILGHPKDGEHVGV